MPTSKETRVRVEDLVKMRAQVWPASGRCVDFPRMAFISEARKRSDSSCDWLVSSMERNFIGGKGREVRGSWAKLKE